MKTTWFLTILLFLSLTGYTQSSLIKMNKISVEAPFEMPDILIPNFKELPKYIITDFGAEANDKEKNALAIEQAIAKAAVRGGSVVIPPGKWHTKKIHLKSNVNLHIAEGATLLFSAEPKDYLPAVYSSWEGLECYNYSPLIYAFGLKNVALSGTGTIKAQLDVWRKWFPRPKPHMESIKNLYNWAQDELPVEKRNMVNDTSNLRPQFIQFNRCENVLIEDIKIRNSPFWTVHLYLSKNIVVRNIDIYAHGHNNDGIDPEMSQNILIENCVFDQGDDAIAIKSGRNPEGWRLQTPSKNIVIRNCTMKDGHQLLAIGSELSGGIENILVENCEAGPGAKLMHLLFIKTNERMGGYVKNIYFKNIKAQDIQDGILGIDTDVLYQWRTLVSTRIKKTTPIENINLENIQAKKGKFISKINGNPESPAKNVMLKNVKLENNTQERIQNKFVKNFSYN
ncbi:glycoside hydrolase family 28 protein [Sphingobacterium bovisgrunnientis]|uniref:glycoside hydrolase family 28 protein n=1 Tax=Sphingobacterium bovisgrunnientis TaxID=1874697 RepID=UPI001359831B|nr:glycoside hydrolase family 28 protein [Sphingobacterium bovisgrunnientis]